MNSHVHVRAVRAGVSLCKTAVLGDAWPRSRRLRFRFPGRGGEREGAVGFSGATQVAVLRQADTYLSKCLRAGLVLR